MNLRRPFVLPCVFLIGSAVVIACGDDDTSIPPPGVDAGSSSGQDGGGSSSSSSSGAADSGDDAPTSAAPVITTTTIASGEVNVAATAVTLAASGATPITWEVTKGALPPGMTLSGSGEYSGTPTLAGDFTFTVTATNAAGKDTQELTHTVTPKPVDGYVLLSTIQLASFTTAAPASAGPGVPITGITAGDLLVSIDRRPQNNFVYGLGYNATTKNVTLYVIDPVTAHANPVGPPSGFAADITGTVFGMDVNPSVDRIRVVTGTGQNFRINPNTGAVIDGQPAVGVQPDDPLNGGTSAVASETAYTNNIPNNGGITTQYTVTAKNLYIQVPPNDGTLTSSQALTNLDELFGLDIPPGVNAPAANQPPATGSAFAAAKLTGASETQLVRINLVGGAITPVGNFPFTNVIGLTMVGVASSRPMVALTESGTSLVRFSEAAPGTTTMQNLGAAVDGEVLVGIDYRPATGQLYGLGINHATDSGTLYIVDPQTGALTVVGAASSVAFVNGAAAPIDFPNPATAGYGFDFNPAADRIRVTTSTGLNFRINPNNGGVPDGDPNTAGTNTDAPLTGGQLDGVAYTNGAPGLTPGVTTEYGLDANTSSLHIIANPNSGVLGAAIPVKSNGAALDFTAVSGFDIPPSVVSLTAGAAVPTGKGYAVLTVGGNTSLYSINLVDGTAAAIGAIGTGVVPLRGLAVGR